MTLDLPPKYKKVHIKVENQPIKFKVAFKHSVINGSRQVVIFFSLLKICHKILLSINSCLWMQL